MKAILPSMSNQEEVEAVSVFTVGELRYFTEQRIGRVSTADPQGNPHVVPVRFHPVRVIAWGLDPEGYTSRAVDKAAAGLPKNHVIVRKENTDE